MKVIVFDESHEKDLQNSINAFLCSGNYDIIDLQFSTSIAVNGEEQIYCFSAIILYREK